MKKYFIFSVLFVLLGTFSNVQANDFVMPATPDNGVTVYGSVRLCNYEEACFIAANKGKYCTDKFEVSYDSSDKLYGIYMKVKGDIINLAVKYVSGGEGAYTYKGFDRMSGLDVVVSTERKLSLYLNNYGVNSWKEVDKSKGLVFVFPSTYMVTSVIPIKNK